MTDQLKATYRIDLLLDDAMRALRAFKQGLEDVRGPVGATDGLNKGLDATETKVRKVAAAQKDAAQEGTTAEKAAAAEAAAAAKAAADEALRIKRAQLAEEKRLAKEAADFERAARRKALDEERAAQKAANFERNQNRMLGPQVTDIAVGLATGQSLFMVLLQQGGQLRDIFGSVGGAFKALMSIFTVGRVLVGGLTAGFVALATAAYQGAKESDALNKALALNGNAAGQTASSLERSATSIAKSQHAAIGDVREALAQAVGTGKLVGPTLESAGRAAVALAKLSGQTAAEEIKSFDDMANGVAEWAAKKNQAYNFMTVAEYQQLRALEASGRQQEAMREVLDKLAATMEQRAVPAVGALEKAYHGLGAILSSVWDSLKGIGRETLPEQRLADLKRQLADLDDPDAQRAKGAGAFGAVALRKKLLADIAAQQALVDQQRQAAAKASADAQENQNKIDLAKDKGYQGALQSIEQEGSKALLSTVTAGLDARQAAIDSANARGLLSATDYAVKTNAIEQQRIQAQLANAQRLRDFEATRQAEYAQRLRDFEAKRKPGEAGESGGPGTQAEVKAQEARLLALNTQVADLESKLRTASAKGREAVDAAALTEARSDAEKWAQAWQTAATQVRAFTAQNAEYAAARLTDPIARADAEAQARIATAKQQLADVKRDVQIRIDLTIDPAQKAELQKQLNGLETQGGKSIENQGNLARFNSLRASWSVQTEALTLLERELDQQVAKGALTVEQAEQRKFEARSKAVPQLNAILEAMSKLPGLTEEDRNAIDSLRQKLVDLQAPVDAMGDAVRGSVKSEFASFFTDVASGAKTAGQAFMDFVGGVAKATLNVIGQRLGEQLANSLLPKGGGSGGLIETGVKFVASLFHSGGVVGSGGTSRTLGMSALSLAGAVARAPRYHTGGIAGYDPSSEQLSVLKKGEEVLTEDNPRHVKNFKAGSGGVGDIKVAVAVNGAQGDQASLQGAGNRLGEVVRGAINAWAVEESREGGILARGAR